jgi:peptide/nickel transport system substrate-binding protein
VRGEADGVIDLGKPTGDKRIRQAIAYALDPKQMDQRMNLGTGYPGFEFFLKGSKFDVGPMAETNVEKAKALVDAVKKEKNWDGSISVLCQAEQASGPAFVLAVATMLDAVGFKSKQDVKPSTEYVTSVQTTRNYDVACWGFNVSDESPEAALSRHVLSVAGGNTGGNAMNLNNPAIDAQILAVRAAKTDAEKKGGVREDPHDLERRSPLDRVQQRPRSHRLEQESQRPQIQRRRLSPFDKAWIDS